MGLRCPVLLFLVLAGCLMIGVNAFSTTETSAHHEVKAIINSAVDLPCDVELSECGSTVHSVKVYKTVLGKNDGEKDERVYSLVISNDSSLALDRAEKVLARPKERAKFSLDTDPPSLRIDHVFMVDEGEYRCDVTYVQMLEGCRTSAKATLITLNRPDKPEIRIDNSDITVSETRIGPFDEGMQLTLTCEAAGGKPPAQITWFNGSEPMAKPGAKVQLGIGTVDVTLTRPDLHSKFRCEAFNEALEAPYSTWVKADVYVRPLILEIIPPKSDIVEDKVANLTCEVRGARPAAAVEWLNGTDVIQSDSFFSEQIEETSSEEDSNGDNDDDDDEAMTYTTRSTYTFVAKKHDFGVFIKCRGRNAVMESDIDLVEDSYQLDVHYAPRVTLEPNGFMAVNYSGSVVLTCRYDANPSEVKRVRWQRDGLEIGQKRKKTESDDDEDDDDNDNDDSNDFEDIVDDDNDENGDDDNDDDDDDVDDGRSAKLRIKHVTHEHKGVYSCMFANSAGRGISPKTLTLDVYYPPVTEIGLVPSLAHEHEEENVTLECEVTSANPEEILAYRWFKNDEVFAETENDTYTLIAVNRFDVANYSCSARNEMGWGEESEDEELVVMFLPGPSTISFTPDIAVKGNSLTISCETKDLGQPKATHYRWHRDEFLIDEYGPDLHIQKVTSQVVANFSCAAVNAAGEGPAAWGNVPVIAPPELIQGLPPTHGALANETNITLSCWVECSPLCNISWTRNGQDITKDNKRYAIKVTNIGQDLGANRLESSMSTLTWRMQNWPNARLTRNKDDAEYSCISKDNLAGDGVRSSTYFRVQYPPEAIHVSAETVDVIEDSAPDVVDCDAEGLPRPTFVWTYGDVVVSSTPSLNLNYSFTRGKSGNYTCIATNRHGKISAVTVINVQYKPSCNATSRIVAGGTVVLECLVDANPKDVSFKWFHEGENITEDAEEDDETSRLKFTEGPAKYGQYQCIASNSVGSSDPCTVEITEEGGWWETLNKNKTQLTIAAIVAALLLLLVIILIIVLLRRKSKSADYEDGTVVNGKKKKASLPKEADSKTFYENLPFHGLQAPPNKPFKPILPDLEYADVDFPARPLNNNQPISKAKIVEKILDEADDDTTTGKIPARPPRSKPSARK